MLFNRLRVVVFAVVTAIGMASCSGGGSHSLTPSTDTQVPQAGNVVQTYDIKTSQGLAATVTLHSNAELSNLAIAFKSEAPAQSTSRRSPMSVLFCPIAPIIITNNSPNTKTITLGVITVKLKCSMNALFGATLYQIIPAPTTLSPITPTNPNGTILKVGDATANGTTLTFTASPNPLQIKLNGRTTYQITILPEKSTADVAFPVVNGAPTTLTANKPSDLKSDLVFTYTTAVGDTTYVASCQFAHDPVTGALNPELVGLPEVGKPKFFCDLTPADPNSPVTFGGTGSLNSFVINNPDPDRAVITGNSVTQGYECTATSATVTSASCNVPTFQIVASSSSTASTVTTSTTSPPIHHTFVEGNVQDLRACVPQTPNVDCNGVGTDPQTGSVTSVPGGRDIQVLVADDPTYTPGPSGAPFPWTGDLYPSVTGACQLSTAAEGPLDNTDIPPGYSDTGGPNPAGPNEEIDVHINSVATTSQCVFTVTEDPTGAYVNDFTNPVQPAPRSATITLTVTPGGGD